MLEIPSQILSEGALGSDRLPGASNARLTKQSLSLTYGFQVSEKSLTENNCSPLQSTVLKIVHSESASVSLTNGIRLSVSISEIIRR